MPGGAGVNSPPYALPMGVDRETESETDDRRKKHMIASQEAIAEKRGVGRKTQLNMQKCEGAGHCQQIRP